MDPGYVVIALSLGNEGIKRCALGQDPAPGPRVGCSPSRDGQDAISRQFLDGLQRLIKRARDNGIVPIIGLTYARGDFDEVEYAHTRKANIEINSWDVPSINLLGAIDDGYGRWARMRLAILRCSMRLYRRFSMRSRTISRYQQRVRDLGLPGFEAMTDHL